MTRYKLGVACVDQHTMKHPFLMVDVVMAENYEAARELFLADVTVKKLAANDTVVVLEVGDASA